MNFMQHIVLLFVLAAACVLASPPGLAQDPCQCEAEPYSSASPDADDGDYRVPGEGDTPEPEAEEEEPQQHDEYATQDETPDVAPDLQVEPVSSRSFRPQRRQYSAPFEPTAASFANPLDPAMQALICPLFFGGLAFLLIVGVFRLVSHFDSISKTRRDITAVERHTETARQIEQRLNDAAREADAFIEGYRADQYRRGHDA